MQHAFENQDAVGNETPPAAGHAEIRIVAATPEAARAVAEVIRLSFAGTEQRSYPVPDGGTRLHLTVDTGSAAASGLSWLTTSEASALTGTHVDEV
ncbi:hypothetical protein [Streptomyces sp. NPDC053755]|uniref:hypothetical protein n=1 Tax=Streptomyces sp. NPDC053755 TaxID=3155815 RepID=UPI0034394B62